MRRRQRALGAAAWDSRGAWPVSRRGPARGGAGTRGVSSLSSRREFRKIAEPIGGPKRGRTRNPGGEVARGRWGRRGGAGEARGGGGAEAGGGPRDSRLCAARRRCIASPSPWKPAPFPPRDPSAFLPLQHPFGLDHWGRDPTAGPSRTARALALGHSETPAGES